MKRYAFAAVFAACVMLSGCGDNAKQSEASVQTSQTEQSTTTTQTTTTTTAKTTTTTTTCEESDSEPTENTEQARLERLILGSIPDEDRRGGNELIKPIFGDLDGNGAEELIAIYGDPNDHDKELGFGDIWFASEDEAEKLSGTWYSDEPIYVIGGEIFLNVMTPGLWGQSYSLIRIAYGNAESAMPVDYSFCEGWEYDEETRLFTLTLATADPEVSETRKFMFSDYTRKLEAFQALSDSTKYYACRYEQTADYMRSEEFPDKALIDSAREQLLLSDTYKEVYDRAKESLPDREPLIAVKCSFVYTCDLDSDGLNEYAFLFNLSPDFNGKDDDMVAAVWGAINPNSPFIGVICDSKGNFHVCDKKFAMNAEIAVLRYNGFAQFVFFGGVSNNSSLADFYSYYDGEFELELREFNVYGIRDGFLVQTMAQCYNAWLILWNDDIKGYVTPVAYTLPNRDEILKQLPLTDKERENCEGAALKLLAGKYYCIANLCFEKVNEEYVRVRCEDAWNYGLGERHLPIYDPFRIPLADIDYDTAVANAIPVE